MFIFLFVFVYYLGSDEILFSSSLFIVFAARIIFTVLLLVIWYAVLWEMESLDYDEGSLWIGFIFFFIFINSWHGWRV